MIVAIIRKLKVLNCSDKNEIFLKQNINHRLGGPMISLSQHMPALSNTFENVKFWGFLYKVGLKYHLHSSNHRIDSSFPKSVIFDRVLRLPKNALKYFRLVGGQEGREALFETFTHDASVVIIIILVTLLLVYVLYNKAAAAALLKVRNYSHCSKKS